MEDSQNNPTEDLHAVNRAADSSPVLSSTPRMRECQSQRTRYDLNRQHGWAHGLEVVVKQL